MLQWFHRLIPRQGNFFPLFGRHAVLIVSAAHSLREMLSNGDEINRYCQEILRLEHEADTLARDVLVGLRTTFITPFDRTDIQSLITSMDDSIDQIFWECRFQQPTQLRVRSWVRELLGGSRRSAGVSREALYRMGRHTASGGSNRGPIL
jgi:Protein of unknown function DUF47